MTRHHSRYLLGAVGLPLVLILGGVAVVSGPWSPFALDHANGLYTAGDAPAARAAYAEIADGWHFPWTRAEAASRAGLLAAQAGEIEAATTWLHRAVDLSPAGADRARLLLTIAELYRDRLAAPARAAELCERAARENGDPRYLAEAGRLWERAGDPERALAAWRAAEVDLAAIDARMLEEARSSTRRLRAALDGAADDGAASPDEVEVTAAD